MDTSRSAPSVRRTDSCRRRRGSSSLRACLAALAALAGTTGGVAAAGKTFNVGGHIFCNAATPGGPTGFCGFASQNELVAVWYNHVAEVNREFDGPYLTGFSFHAKVPVIHNDQASWWGLDMNKNFVPNNTAMAILNGLPSDEITMTLWEGLGSGWTTPVCPNPNGPPPPIITMTSPPTATLANLSDGTAGGLDGTAWAHEIGHMLCLAHTHSAVDPAESNMSNGFEDRDEDDEINRPHCGTVDPVLDTPGDCGPAELVQAGPPKKFENHLPADGYEYWKRTKQSTVDPGSPHDTWCTETSYHDALAVPFTFSPPTNTALSMSYFPSDCKGPYVIGGQRTDAFSPQQVIRMQQCVAAADGQDVLVDVCQGAGGDSDGDGWCDATDLCPNTPEALPDDSDWDQVPDACDTCPGVFDASNLDTDHDGVGDSCDPDDDNDGCLDESDQHPKNDMVPVGPAQLKGCPPGVFYASEAIDHDGDGVLDCADSDDDNDRIIDLFDDCPIVVGQQCSYPGKACNLPDLARLCEIVPCLLDWEWLYGVNPPDQTHFMAGRVYAVGDDLMLVPGASRTLSETAKRLAPTQRGARAQLRILQEGKQIADLGQFDVPIPGSVPRAGAFVRVALDHTNRRLVTSAAWTVSSVEARLSDADRDRVPDPVDRCQRTPDPDQLDADRDGYGDACDFDVDGDNRVGADDVALVRGCLGATSPGGVILSESFASPAPPVDESGWDLWIGCARADFDHNGVVDRVDLDKATRAQGSASGPSGLVQLPGSGGGTHGDAGGPLRRALALARALLAPILAVL